MLKASQLVQFANGMIGQAYWYACCVYKCTTSQAKSKAKQWPEHYTSDRYERLKEQISKKQVCCDCVGLIKGFFWTDGGADVLKYIKGQAADFTNTKRLNGMPDHSANTLYEWCTEKQGAEHGKINTIPDVPGIIVYKPGHVGIYVGKGYVVEAMGFNYGVVKTKLNQRPWVAWTYLPSWVLEYDTVKEDFNIFDIFKPAEKEPEPEASAERDGVLVEVTGSRVNVRNSPSMGAKVVRRVNFGDRLTVVSVNKKTKWARLSDGNYICTDYIKSV